MAKASKKSVSALNIDLLKQIASGFVTRISQGDAVPLLAYEPALIDVNTNDIVDGKALVRLTDEGIKMVNASVNAPAINGSSAQFAVITNAVLPARKRLGRAAGSAKYPFVDLNIGGSFFVPKSSELPNPIKTLASTISAQNMKYAEKTGGTKEVERTKRGAGNKAVTDEQGNKVKEHVTVPVYRPTRKFAMRSVTAGQQCGEWVAPADGVLISRVALET